jgi:hypothetical protein
MINSRELTLTAILAEYEALRAEVTKLVDRQYPIVYWGISSVGVIVAVIVNTWESLTRRPLILLFLFFFILPAFVTGYVITWSHLILKIASLGSYLYLVESKIATHCGLADDNRSTAFSDLPVGWEHRLWETGGHQFLIRSYTTVKWLLGGILVLTNSLGVALALHYFRSAFGTNVRSMLVLGGIAFFLALWIFVWTKLFQHISAAISTADRETQRFLASLD